MHHPATPPRRRPLALALAAILAAAWALALPAAAGDPADAPWSETLPRDEQRWLDRDIPADERALLDTTIGYAPPEPPDSITWRGGEPVSFQQLRGRVVVVQSWTTAHAAGRSAPKRAHAVLRRVADLGPDGDVALLAVHTPEGLDDDHADRRLERSTRTFTTAVDADGSWCDELGFYERPTALVLDKSGAIRYAGLSTSGAMRAAVKLREEDAASLTEPAPLPPRDDREAQALRTLEGGADAATAGDDEFPPIRGSVRHARDLRGEHGPELHAQEWLRNPPSTEGKVVVAEFWATWCGPCIRGIPHLNDLQAAFPDTVVVAGISNESADVVRGFLTANEMNYSVGVDPLKRMRSVVANRGIPHCIVMCPERVVRWQGHPGDLREDILRDIVAASGLAGGGGDAGSLREKRWVAPAS